MKDFDEDGPQLYELIFGSIFAWTFLFEAWKRLTKKYCHRETPLLQASYFKSIPLWKFLFMHTFGASFYCINHYLGQYAPAVIDTTLGLYSLLYLVCYYFVLVHPVMSKLRRYHSPSISKFLLFAILIAIGYTLLFILTENLARVMVKGKFFEIKVLPDGYVPEAVVTSFSFIGSMFLIVYYGSRYEGRSQDMTVIDDGSDTNDFPH